MKIVAQSTVPGHVPYLHVGYVSAVNDYGPFGWPMTWILLTGAFLIFAGIISAAGNTRRRKKGVKGWFVKWKKPILLALGGVVVILLIKIIPGRFLV